MLASNFEKQVILSALDRSDPVVNIDTEGIERSIGKLGTTIEKQGEKICNTIKEEFNKNNLLKAVESNNIEDVLELLNRGADINYIRESDGKDLLSIAISKDYSRLVNILLKVDINSDQGLIYAVNYNCNGDYIDLLIPKASKQGLTSSLFYCNKYEVLMKLIEAGADINAKGNHGIPFAFYVLLNYNFLEEEQYKIINKLLEKGLKLTYRDFQEISWKLKHSSGISSFSLNLVPKHCRGLFERLYNKFINNFLI